MGIQAYAEMSFTTHTCTHIGTHNAGLVRVTGGDWESGMPADSAMLRLTRKRAREGEGEREESKSRRCTNMPSKAEDAHEQYASAVDEKVHNSRKNTDTTDPLTQRRDIRERCRERGHCINTRTKV